ncbi:MAG: hypothetical protein KIT84_09810 [Labilithrix sp.]|nr:hypothetical protein [Labilithrix sp.]MCW5811297.1 hypothetical protein [Labilithrix sp.]
MIRIGVTEAALRKTIENIAPDWHAKKKKSWSDIKAAYLALQSELCAYCEGARDFIRSEITDADTAPAENDGEFAVEHFRPKGITARWPDRFSLERFAHYGIDPKVVFNGHANGYDELRFSPWNYVVSCYTCNSTLKGNRFPIALAAGVASGADRQHIAALNKTERPLLLFPLGALDVDPEHAIGWNGVIPIPNPTATAATQLRAKVTIVFFRLDGVGRPRLLEARFRQLGALIGLITLLPEMDREAAVSAGPFRACLRAFYAEWKKSPQAAAARLGATNAEIEKIAAAVEARRKAAASGKLRRARPKRAKKPTR